MIKLSDYIMKYLVDLGVGHVFMLSGGGCMHLVDSLGREKRLSYVCCLHEQVAALAAASYAQYTNNIGVALVTTGPGGTNAVTGVAAAWADSIPLLVISGQVKRSDISTNGARMLGFQEIGIIEIVKSITKYSVTVTEPKEIKYHLQKAVHLAKAGRPGPVWIDIPLDVQATLIDENELNGFSESPSAIDFADKIEETIKLINAAKRPVIIAGYGVKLANATNKFYDVMRKLKIPILTTWKAMDLLSEYNEYYFGRPGSIGQRGANFVLQTSDLIISIGARLDYGQIGYSHDTFARAAKKVIVDIDYKELTKFKFDVHVAIAADAGMFLDCLLEKITDVENIDRSSWLSKCKTWKEKYPIVLPKHINCDNNVSVYALVQLLSEHTNSDDVFAPGNSGACSEVFMQAYKVKHGQRIVSMNSIGSMGTGLPCAIGASIASGGKRTICVNGDGGIQMNIQDLETISRLNLPIKIFILNNNGYGSIKNMQHNYFDDFFVGSTPESGVTLPNIIKIATAYGINSASICSNEELSKKIESILCGDGPFICEIIVNPSEQTEPRVTSIVAEDGKMMSMPLEDLWPFLERDEFNKEMITS